METEFFINKTSLDATNISHVEPKHTDRVKPLSPLTSTKSHWQERPRLIRKTTTLSPPTRLLPLTVGRLGSAAVAADVFNLRSDLAVDHKRRVVVVGGGLVSLLPAWAAAGLHPAQAESPPPPPPPPRFLLLRHRSGYWWGVGGRPGPGPGPGTYHIGSKARHVWAGLQGWTSLACALVEGEGVNWPAALSTINKSAIMEHTLPLTS